MKNIFKFMGLALMASSLMIACDKNNEEPETPADNTPAGITVTFNGASWTPADATIAAGTTQSGINYILSDLYGSTSEDFPEAYVVTTQREVGSVTNTYTEDNMSLGQSGVVTCEYYNETALVNQSSGVYYGDWWAEEVTCDVKAIDMTNMKLSYILNANMFSALEAYVNGQYQAGASKGTMAISAGQVSMVNADAK